MRTSIILPITLLLVGCATGPPYVNTHTQDSATLVVSANSRISIEVTEIDGATAPEPPLYLAPGRHHLSIRLSDPHSGEAFAEEDIVVGANKSYRIVLAYLQGNGSFYNTSVLQIVDVESGAPIFTDRQLNFIIRDDFQPSENIRSNPRTSGNNGYNPPPNDMNR